MYVDDDEAVNGKSMTQPRLFRSPTAMSPRPRMFLRVPPRPPRTFEDEAHLETARRIGHEGEHCVHHRR